MLDLSKRNKKIADSRWKSKIAKEKAAMIQNEETRILKAMLCGFLAGDGSVQVRREKSYNHYQLDFFPDDELMKDVYIGALNKVYLKNPSTKKLKNYFAVRKTSKLIVTDLLKLAKFDTHNWNLPNSILTCQESKINWLRAFFSAEAYVGKKTIRVQTVNENGMKNISNLLSEFQINHCNYKYQPKQETYSKVHIISINQKSARERYYKIIGFYHKKKTETLKATLNL